MSAREVVVKHPLRRTAHRIKLGAHQTACGVRASDAGQTIPPQLVRRVPKCPDCWPAGGRS